MAGNGIRRQWGGGDDGPPRIEEYAYLSDCHSCALVALDGSIDWCCMPRIDSPSCFGRLLGRERGGYCRIAPEGTFTSERRYLDGTLVLETVFTTEGGSVRLRDCLAMREGGARAPRRQILRLVEGISGRVRLAMEVVPRFDYGAIRPWIRCHGEGAWSALGGADGLLVASDRELTLERRHDLRAVFDLAAGEKACLSLTHRPPELLDRESPGAVGGEGSDFPGLARMEQLLDETEAWWRRWSRRTRGCGPHKELSLRSGLVLKALTNAPTGAIAAAPTTSLPESMQAGRNWDYRLSWVRDSAFTLRALGRLGHDKEADRFGRFIERSAAGSAEELQIVFGVGGERRLYEREVPELGGYLGRGPVRVGNGAYTQEQLDIHGEMLDLAWRRHLRGHDPDADYWTFLREVVNRAASEWHRADRGIWEVRGEPRHFVHSKAACWTALARGAALAEEIGRPAPLSMWQSERDAVREAVEREGYDEERGVFVRSFGARDMDAALLLLPVMGFVDFADPRMVRTTDAVMEELFEDGLLRRYRAGGGPNGGPNGRQGDGLSGREGVFLACTFWLAECLARQGRIAKAREVFDRAASLGNDVGLFSEEYDTAAGRMLGNFPQGLTHLSLVAAALALDEADGECDGEPEDGRHANADGGKA
ncbi:glycoside hydrolase 15-related protein [Desulfovibrio sp. X2]|uniref:glycoside hydrolase family 15 protein n=1 Tax=Desulfovibrio sp. X2 TaxID=941449 RepID=UPI000358735C|nr:glycoside hydrolase family 15 protein [Desulfovibrio sp. X2]EPR43557.1 glycoside hydrolase 15-related protein [Desulfovibrio sp. X2]